MIIYRKIILTNLLTKNLSRDKEMFQEFDIANLRFLNQPTSQYQEKLNQILALQNNPSMDNISTLISLLHPSIQEDFPEKYNPRDGYHVNITAKYHLARIILDVLFINLLKIKGIKKDEIYALLLRLQKWYKKEIEKIDRKDEFNTIKSYSAICFIVKINLFAINLNLLLPDLMGDFADLIEELPPNFFINKD